MGTESIGAEATREILWNVSSTGNVVAMYVLCALACLVGLIGVWRHTEIWLSGKADPEHLGRPLLRVASLLENGLFQERVIRERQPGFAHTLIFVGFIVLLFTTTMVFVDHDLGIRIYRGEFYLAVTVLSDLFGLAFLIGCLLMYHRRYVQAPDQLHSRTADALMLHILTLLLVQGFVLEGLRIHATDDPWAAYSPVGLLFAKFFWSLSEEAARTLHFLTWWFHALTVFGAIALVPYSKFFHVLASSVNLYFAPRKRPAGALSSPGDLEQLLEAGEEFSIGTGTLSDYTWKQLLDLDACTSCGRCQDNCPAYLSGKPLSPKWLVLDSRNHMLALHAEDRLTESKLPESLKRLDQALMKKVYLRGNGVSPDQSGMGYHAAGEYRAKNSLVQSSALSLGADAATPIAGGVLDKDVFWSCTTCMACVEACPVGINHVEQIVENRRHMALMEGDIPSEAQQTLRALETRANPYGPAEDRLAWAEGLDVPVVQPGDSVDYLYWVGCVSAYDKRKQQIAQSLVKLFNTAGISYGVLGTAEGCSGDPARRLGEENLFQMLAKQNIETLKSIKFKTLVANCPHCFNTIKNEYPQFGNLGNGRKPEIIHHSVLLRRLLESGALELSDGDKERITFHDPCYLGRYNGEYEAPRDTLKSTPGLEILEMERSKDKGMCCGAGGGHFWMDMKVGERVNVLRTEQAAETGANKVATGCPYCMQMMEDGVKLTDREGQMEVRDLAEILAERV